MSTVIYYRSVAIMIIIFIALSGHLDILLSRLSGSFGGGSVDSAHQSSTLSAGGVPEGIIVDGLWSTRG